MESNQKLLVSLAHPDDESFGMGGTLALYATRGVDVHLVCGTKGEVGTVAPEFMKGYEDISDLRVHELACAAEHLGLAGVHYLGYRDSGMPGTPDNNHPNALAAQSLDEVAAKLVGYIRKLHPQVVITFDPVGGYHHPDHIAMHEATVRAFHAAGDPEQFLDAGAPYQPEKLYYHIFPRRGLRFVVNVLRLLGNDVSKFGRNKDIDLEMLVGDQDYPVHVSINYNKVADRKEAAGACHASQLDFGNGNRWWDWYRRISRRREYFMRAYPPATNGLHLNDLFAD